MEATLDVERIGATLGGGSLVVNSAAPNRRGYLQNPSLGRRISEDEPPLPHGDYDLAIVIADGLSANAVNAHAAAVTLALSARLPGWSFAPVVLVRQGRVAIGDPIGLALGARAVVVLIGERPGLSAADSLSAYLTWAPRPGRPDSERNCVSNIRSPDGLAPDQAARRIAWLLVEAARLGFTGVELKDRSPGAGVGRLDSP